MVRFSCWRVFRKCVLPEELVKEFLDVLKIPRCLDLNDSIMVLPMSICKFDAKNIPNAFEHVPDLL